MREQIKKNKNSFFVIPGERLGVIEEFIPNDGTYELDGVIHSKFVGCCTIDSIDKKLSVSDLVSKMAVPKIGSIVIGEVTVVQSQQAIFKIFQVGDKIVSGFFSGVLHVSDVTTKYVESMFDVYKIGDVVRAKVISTVNKVFHLSTKERSLGVIYAYCLNCSKSLQIGPRDLQCSYCGKIERRKVAIDYGKIAI